LSPITYNTAGQVLTGPHGAYQYNVLGQIAASELRENLRKDENVEEDKCSATFADLMKESRQAVAFACFRIAFA
jgi:hypothetical protein